MTVRATLDHQLRVSLSTLPEGAGPMLIAALTIPNKAKQEAERNHEWGWQSLPDTINLWETDGDILIMPRGFAATFGEGMRVYGVEIEWTDNRKWDGWEDETLVDLRDYQEKAAVEISLRQQGIYKAPAGSGKTVTILALVARMCGKSIVLVNTKDVLWQWQARARKHIAEDFPIGQIGDDIFDVSDGLTVATAQTLHSRFDELEVEGFFDQFSFVCLDECHHATAATYNRLLNRFSARYRVGVSATPDKTGDFLMATNVLGPIFHETKPNDVPFLMKPEVIRVATDFSFGFKGTRSSYQRSNYPQMIQRLVTDPARNQLIVSLMKREEDNHCLAISKRLEHLDILEAMLMDANYQGHVLKLTGKENRDERQRVVELSNNEPCMVLSTLADEALDIPRLDRGFLMFPQKNPGLVTQQVGRFERIHPDKKSSIIYDFSDLKVSVLDSQWKTRRFEVYGPRGYNIRTIRAKDLLSKQLP